MHRRLLAIALALAVIAATGGAANARRPRNLWATVNICDTDNHPDQLGIRARAPGNGRRQRIWMRFRAQYRDNGRWRRAGSSPWRRVGSARYTYQESGWTFEFDPGPTDDYLMRGVVRVEWRRHGKVLRHRRLVTSAHHPSRGADPTGYSSATCHIRGFVA